MSIHNPRLIAGSSEGCSVVFKPDYKGRSASLAQSHQLYKKMAINKWSFWTSFCRWLLFRTEDSYTHKHLCEFIGLDVEMEIKNATVRWYEVILMLLLIQTNLSVFIHEAIELFMQVTEIVDHLFVTIFDHLNHNCKELLEGLRLWTRQYPFQPLKVKGIICMYISYQVG